ncbi:MAG TPA: DUF4013 domain-containing protein [Methanocorpusculum sp.]|nr:DUF4013 domain-containing protein [Methanocorpusculum sp.]
MADLFEITGKALKTAAEGTFKNPGAWLIMALLTAVICYIAGLFTCQIDTEVSAVSTTGIILIVVAVLLSIIVMGAYVKTLRNEKPGFKQFGKTIKEGFLYSIIALIYTIVLILLASFMVYGTGTWGSLLTEPMDLLVYYLAIGICWIIFAVIFVIIFVLTSPASREFGRTGRFSSAFRIVDLMELTQKVSWGKCILGTILQMAVGLLIMLTTLAISYLLTRIPIPVAGDILGVIFAGLFIPFAMIFILNFCARLYEGVTND